jgi:hypothetical protein
MSLLQQTHMGAQMETGFSRRTPLYKRLDWVKYDEKLFHTMKCKGGNAYAIYVGAGDGRKLDAASGEVRMRRD